jgi:hypothetical protein
MRCLTLLAFLWAVGLPAVAQDAEWEQVTGAETLRSFMSGLQAERKARGGSIHSAEYLAEGTGVLNAWGETFARTWKVRGEDQICITAGGEENCFYLDKKVGTSDRYRVRFVATGQVRRFRVSEGTAVSEDTPADVGAEGGAAAASANEMAAKLADPNATIGTMSFNLDYVQFDGDLPGAGDQSSFTLGFQPSLPYPLGGGKNFFVRPLIPIVFQQPVPNATGGFDDVGTELGDIAFDAAVGFSLESGNVFILGLAGAFPTATEDDLGKDQWLLGPEAMFALVKKWGVLAVFASHLWDVAGEDSFNTNITSGQYIYTFFLKDGWSITASPPWSYNHEAEDDPFSISVGIGVGKTVFLKGRPWKLGAQYYHFVEGSDAFGASDQIKVTIGPVISLPWG